APRASTLLCGDSRDWRATSSSPKRPCREDDMQKRSLGKTGLEVSVLGFGGFHLVEITSAEAARLLGAYLDQGGSYIETAASYGDGISETKIGTGVAHR